MQQILALCALMPQLASQPDSQIAREAHLSGRLATGTTTHRPPRSTSHAATAAGTNWYCSNTNGGGSVLILQILQRKGLMSLLGLQSKPSPVDRTVRNRTKGIFIPC